jgi:hypothetical protein
MGHDALNIAENKSRSTKLEMGPDAFEITEMIFGVHNLKIGPNAAGTIENESGSIKIENGT